MQNKVLLDLKDTFVLHSREMNVECLSASCFGIFLLPLPFRSGHHLLFQLVILTI